MLVLGKFAKAEARRRIRLHGSLGKGRGCMYGKGRGKTGNKGGKNGIWPPGIWIRLRRRDRGAWALQGPDGSLEILVSTRQI